jgi:hypothetical protein
LCCANTGGRNSRRQFGDVSRFARNDEATAYRYADGDDVSVNDSFTAGSRGLEDGTNLAGEVEVGVDETQRRSLASSSVVTGHGCFQRSGPAVASGQLRAHEGRGDDFAIASVGFGQQSAE